MEDIPGLSRPLRSALAEAGFSTLESLDEASHPELLVMHGVGARGLERVQAALVERGMTLREVPGSARAPKSGRTDASPEEFLRGLQGRRQAHGELLMELFRVATRTSPAMWGDTMIGFGERRFSYADGAEGVTFAVGFSPRKAKISLYGISPTPELGTYTAGASCVYINKPEDVDLDVLARAVREAYENAG
ncbi:DUF1801 domain-containing protein [Corynebacterium tapiri]